MIGNVERRQVPKRKKVSKPVAQNEEPTKIDLSADCKTDIGRQPKIKTKNNGRINPNSRRNFLRPHNFPVCSECGPPCPWSLGYDEIPHRSCQRLPPVNPNSKVKPTTQKGPVQCEVDAVVNVEIGANTKGENPKSRKSCAKA
ncbi:14109_t:CDS:2, partial [Acaulospora colombiana]